MAADLFGVTGATGGVGGRVAVVYLSFLGAAPEVTFMFARDHWHTEEHVRATGVRHTFLRDSMYMDFLPTFAGTDGVIRGPAGDGHDERTYDVTGSEAITLHQQRRDLYRRLGLR